MTLKLDTSGIKDWMATRKTIPYIRPCSAETEEQVMDTAKSLAALVRSTFSGLASGNPVQDPTVLKE